MCANVYYIMTQNYTISTNHVDNDCHFCTGAKTVALHLQYLAVINGNYTCQCFFYIRSKMIQYQQIMLIMTVTFVPEPNKYTIKCAPMFITLWPKMIKPNKYTIKCAPMFITLQQCLLHYDPKLYNINEPCW